MRNDECIIEQYRGNTLVRSFAPSGDRNHPWTMSVNGKRYARTHAWVLSKVLATLVKGSTLTTVVVPINCAADAQD